MESAGHERSTLQQPGLAPAAGVKPDRGARDQSGINNRPSAVTQPGGPREDRVGVGIPFQEPR